MPSKEEIQKIGSPKMWGIKCPDKDSVRDFYMVMGGYCSKCGLPFKYRDVSMKKAKEKFENKYGVTIGFHITCSHMEIIDNQYDIEEC